MNKTKNTKIIDKFLFYIKNERKFSVHTIRNYNNDLLKFNEFLFSYDNELNFLNIDKTAIK